MKKKIKKLNKKRIIFFIVIVLFVLFGLLIVREKVKDNKETVEIQNKSYSSSKDFISVKEVVKYMNCTYIREKLYDEGQFYEDIYLTFSKELKNDQGTNKDFYNLLIEIIVDVIDFENFRLIDESKNIEIAVICNKEDKYISNIYINGEENYFNKQESLNSLKKYKKVEITQLQINSSEILDLINNNWKWSKVYLGERHLSTDSDYILYNNSSIKVKTTANEVVNIIFTKNYQFPIVNGITTNMQIPEIISILGEPTFEMTTIESAVIGYKSNNIYIFFSNNEVSVYKVENDYDISDFFKLVDEFSEHKNSNILINSVTDLWTDYTSFIKTDKYTELTYALKGIKIQFGEIINNGVTFYNNYNNSVVENYKIEDIYNKDVRLPDYIYINAQEDLVYLYEVDRAIKESNIEVL